MNVCKYPKTLLALLAVGLAVIVLCDLVLPAMGLCFAWELFRRGPR